MSGVMFMSRKISSVHMICLLLMAVLISWTSAEVGQASGRSAVQCASGPAEDCVENMLQSMTLEEKIGQMVMIGIHGTDVDEESLFMLHQYHIGGIILFDRNMESQEQVRQLNAHLQEQAGEKLPLFLAVDGKCQALGGKNCSCPKEYWV